MVHVQHPTLLPVYTAPGQLLPECDSLAHQKGCVRRKWRTLPLQCPPHFPGSFLPPPPSTPAEARGGSWAAENREEQCC